MDKSFIINLPSDIIEEIRDCVISPYKYTKGCCVRCGLSLAFVENPIICVLMVNEGVFFFDYCSVPCYRKSARRRKRYNKIPLIVISY